jgi:chemotaxis response regulator CheB
VGEMRKCILVVDDNELIRRQIRRILESDQQLEVCAEAKNGADAVRKTRKYYPDRFPSEINLNDLTAPKTEKNSTAHALLLFPANLMVF